MQIYNTDKYQEKLKLISPNLELLDEYTVSNDKLKHKCNICNGEFYATPNNILRGRGCPYCVGKKVLRGFNDILTTHPGIAELLINDSDKVSYTYGTYAKLKFKCKSCGKEYESRPKYVKSLECCKYCKDGISYPEKFMISFFNQIKINYIYQLTKTKFKWCNNYKYDFYFEHNNKRYIVEVNGIQHYEKAFTNQKSKTLIDNINNDADKKNLAKNYVDEYIELDCRKSNYDFIVNSIKNSLLSELFEFNDDILKNCQSYALSSIMISVCKDYNAGLSVGELVKRYNISLSSVNTYLHNGSIIGICDYNSKDSRKRSYGKPVICLNNFEIFDCISDAARKYHIAKQTISDSCTNHRIVNTITGLDKWMYLNEYNSISNDNIPEYVILDNYHRPVRCINTNETFNSIAEAQRWCGSKTVTDVLMGKQKTGGRHPVTHERLKWEYVQGGD